MAATPYPTTGTSPYVSQHYDVTDTIRDTVNEVRPPQHLVRSYTKFKIMSDNGTINRSGPGYKVDVSGNFVITKPVLYHPRIAEIIENEKNVYGVHTKKLNEQLIKLLSTVWS